MRGKNEILKFNEINFGSYKILNGVIILKNLKQLIFLW